MYKLGVYKMIFKRVTLNLFTYFKLLTKYIAIFLNSKQWDRVLRVIDLFDFSSNVALFRIFDWS